MQVSSRGLSGSWTEVPPAGGACVRTSTWNVGENNNRRSQPSPVRHRCRRAPPRGNTTKGVLPTRATPGISCAQLEGHYRSRACCPRTMTGRRSRSPTDAGKQSTNRSRRTVCGRGGRARCRPRERPLVAAASCPGVAPAATMGDSRRRIGTGGGSADGRLADRCVGVRNKRLGCRKGVGSDAVSPIAA